MYWNFGKFKLLYLKNPSKNRAQIWCEPKADGTLSLLSFSGECQRFEMSKIYLIHRGYIIATISNLWHSPSFSLKSTHGLGFHNDLNFLKYFCKFEQPQILSDWVKSFFIKRRKAFTTEFRKNQGLKMSRIARHDNWLYWVTITERPYIFIKLYAWV